MLVLVQQLKDGVGTVKVLPLSNVQRMEMQNPDLFKVLVHTFLSSTTIKANTKSNKCSLTIMHTVSSLVHNKEQLLDITNVHTRCIDDQLFPSKYFTLPKLKLL